MRLTNLFIALMILSFASLNAQNLQLHYDFRHSLYGGELSTENYFTATYEMFKADENGSTFMFIDYDFSYDQKNPGLIYGEISHDFKLKKCPIQPHIEYNGGLGSIKGTTTSFSIPNSFLAGASYPFQLGNVFMSTYVVYKLNAFKKVSHDAQWTVTWSTSLFNKKLTIDGFMDTWSENRDREGTKTVSGKKLIFLSEPQFWYDITPKISFGSETEISRNFHGKSNKWYFIPTIAGKWVI